MRLAWFTPFDRRSAIGRFSVSVTRELAHMAAVDVWHPATSEPLPTPARLCSFSCSSDVPKDVLRTYDIVFYNMGNYSPYHADIYEVSRRHPGIFVLHDLVMQDFFWTYFLERRRQPSAYEAALVRHYGEPGKELAEAILGGKASLILTSGKVLEFPLFEEVIQGAYGVITHSVWARERVKEKFAGPVTALFLPYEGSTPVRDVEASEIEKSPERVLILTAGVINPHKRVDAVIRVLGRHRDLRERVLYLVVGPIEEQYRLALARLIAEQNLTDVVKLCGRVPDDRFAACLRSADICVNLRWPPTEAASASLVEQMCNAKPVIVTDVGFYSELPSDCVCRISPARECEELAIVLRNLVERPELRAELGGKARRFAEQHFLASAYARAVLEFAWQVRSLKPLLEVADRLGRELNAVGVPSTAELVDVVSAAAWEVFGYSDGGPEDGPP